MSWETFLQERRIGVIATVGIDGTPHAVPVELVVDGGNVYAWCHATSAKARNVVRTGRAALVAYKGDTHVMVRGPARLLFGGDDTYARVTHGFLSKYDRDEEYGNDALIEIVPERVAEKTY